MAYPESSPVVEAELEPIDVAILKERKRVWYLEDETGEDQSSHWLEYLSRAKSRGVEHIVLNFCGELYVEA